MTFLIFNPINIYLQGRWLRMFFSKLLLYHRSPQGLSMLFIDLNCMIIFNQYWIFQSFKTFIKSDHIIWYYNPYQGKFSLSFLHLSGAIISLENRRNLCMFKLNSLRQWCLSPSIFAIMFNLKIVIIICILFHGHNANFRNQYTSMASIKVNYTLHTSRRNRTQRRCPSAEARWSAVLPS